MAEHNMYNRQISTESGWDNPFRPDGDLSREADEIVSLIKGGKPITPTPPVTNEAPICDEKEEMVHANNLNASPPASPQTQTAIPVQQKTANGTKNGAPVLQACTTGPVQVQRRPPPEPQQPERVTIKKKQKCQCCVIQ